MINTMENTINEISVTKSLKLLRDGFKNELATYVCADERMRELLMEIVSDFVEINIPVVDEYNRTELAMMMMESLDVIAR